MANMKQLKLTFLTAIMITMMKTKVRAIATTARNDITTTMTTAPKLDVSLSGLISEDGLVSEEGAIVDSSLDCLVSDVMT